MKFDQRLVSLFLLGILASCTTVRDYPRCYLFRAPNNSDVERVDKDTDELLKALGIDEYGTCKDLVIVNTYSAKHRKLVGVWPSSGCINLRRVRPETAAENDKWIVARCQEFLEQVVTWLDAPTPDSRTQIARAYFEFTCH